LSLASPAQATLAQLALPLLLNSLLGLATTLIDTLIISSHSPEAAGAVSLANQILTVAYDLSVLLGVGATILITHALGRADAPKARTVARVAILANTLLGVLIGVVVWLLAPVLVGLMNVPPPLVADTQLYIRIIAFAIPFNGFLMASVASLRGFSRMRVIFALGVFAFPAYLLLDYLLVLGWGPVPALGAQGSAWATLLVRLGSVGVLLLLLPRVLGLAWRHPLDGARLKPLLHRLLALSTPSVLDNVAYGFYQITLVSFIAGLGVAAVVSRFYALALGAVLPVVIMALSQANEVLVGYRHGAGDQAGIHRQALRSGLVTAGIATLVAVMLYLNAGGLVGFFSQDPAVLALARELLWLTIFIQPLSGLNTVLFHSLRVIGDVHAPVLFSQVVMWGLAVPLAYVLCVLQDYGVAGLWLAMILEEALKTLFMVWRWSRQFRR